MDMAPALLIFTPIFLPVVKNLGMEPIQFGIMMIMNLAIGTITPPVGSVLFVGCSVAHLPVEDVMKQLIPYFLVIVAGLLLRRPHGKLRIGNIGVGNRIQRFSVL